MAYCVNLDIPLCFLEYLKFGLHSIAPRFSLKQAVADLHDGVMVTVNSKTLF